jgi:hypothetical protein
MAYAGPAQIPLFSMREHTTAAAQRKETFSEHGDIIAGKRWEVCAFPFRVSCPAIAFQDISSPSLSIFHSSSCAVALILGHRQSR